MSYIEFAVTSFLLAIMPGTDVIFVAVQSLSKGYKQGIKVAAGLTTGLIIHSIAIALGIGALIVSNEIIFSVIKHLGACYLLYLAIMAALQVKDVGKSNEITDQSLQAENEILDKQSVNSTTIGNNARAAVNKNTTSKNTISKNIIKKSINNKLTLKFKDSKQLLSPYKKGLIMNLLNPKVIIFFLALFPQFIDTSINVYISTISLGLTMAIVTFFVFSSVSIICSYAKKTISPSLKAKKIMKILEATVYATLSALVIFNL